MKARAILCPHQPPTRVITQFRKLKAVLTLLALPSSFCPRTGYLKEIYIYIYTPDQLKADITLDVRSSSFWCSLWFKNAFTFGCWCHSNRFLILRNHTGKVVPRAYHSCCNPFYIRHLFVSFSFSFIFSMRYCTKAFETNVIYNSAERRCLLINGALKMGGE